MHTCARVFLRVAVALVSDPSWAENSVSRLRFELQILLMEEGRLRGLHTCSLPEWDVG